MYSGNVVSLPGSAFKCLFEVSDHEFKARSVSLVVDFSPDSSAIRGRAGFIQGWVFAEGRDREKDCQRAEGVSKGVTVGDCDKEGGEDRKEWRKRER